MKIKIKTIIYILLNIIIISNVFAGEISKSTNTVIVAEIMQDDFKKVLQEGDKQNKEENYKKDINNIKTNKREEENITESLKKEEKEIIIKEVLKKEEVKTKIKIEAEKTIVKNETEKDIIKKLLTQKYQNQIDNVLTNIDKKVYTLPSNTREKIFLKMENSIKIRTNLIKLNKKISKETKDILMEIMDYFLHQTQLRKIGL